jgi:hypothetical protein
MILLFAYDTLLYDDVRKLLLNRDVTCTDYELHGFEVRVGMDGFSYLIENKDSSVNGKILRLLDTDCIILDFWLAQLYTRFTVSDFNFTKPIFFYTYRNYKELGRKRQPKCMNKFLKLSHDEVLELATGFFEYFKSSFESENEEVQ